MLFHPPHKTTRTLFLMPLLFFLALAASAAVQEQFPQAINTFISAARAHPSFRPAQIGIVIQSLDDNSIQYAKNANHAFIPASNAKLVTAAAALELLPAEFRFSTRVFATGNVHDGVLDGNLLLQGEGDPSLTVEHLRTLARMLAQGNPEQNLPSVTRITGRLLLDNSAFPRPGPQWGQNWEKEDLPWYYAAPSSALACNRNAVRLTVRGTRHGQPATITLYPETKLFTIVNNAVTSSRVSTGAITVKPNGYRLSINGYVAPGVELTEDMSVQSPEWFIREQFMAALASEGIIIESNDLPSADRILLAEHQSALLPNLLREMMKISDNHTFEQLRWTMLARLHAEVPLGMRYTAILDDLAGKADIATGRMKLVDGSGLSRDNRLSPIDLLRLLTYVYHAPYFEAFYQLLPVAGVDGTLKKRLTGTTAEGVVRAKTGTMRGVCGLSGYVNSRNGKQFAFSILINGYGSGASQARALQDRIVNFLAGQ